MTSIERTAYPRFKRYYTSSEITKIYTPTSSEIAFALVTNQSQVNYFSFLVLLKVFQRLGYFPKLAEIPLQIIRHISSVLKLSEALSLTEINPRTQHRQKIAIRSQLNVIAYDQKAQEVVRQTISESALVMDNPADLINVAIEELVKNRYELPPFKTLDRLVSHVRNLVNQKLFSDSCRSQSSKCFGTKRDENSKTANTSSLSNLLSTSPNS